MQFLTICTLLSILVLPMPLNTAKDRFSACLPEDVKLDEVVSIEGEATKPVTVRQKLTELKARCKSGKLVDGKGKPIQFVHLIGCWGNPPEDYEEQIERQRAEIKRLKTKFTVVEISCAQGRDLRQIP